MQIYPYIIGMAISAAPTVLFAENVHLEPIKESLQLAEGGSESQVFYKVSFPDCVIGSQSLFAHLIEEDYIDEHTTPKREVSMPVGHLTGKFIVFFEETNADYPAGRYWVDLECASGLARITTTRKDGVATGSISGSHMSPKYDDFKIQAPEGGFSFGN